ncbi:response regulator [Roseivivax sp. CAU 1753]
MRLLVVDDDGIIRDLLKIALYRASYFDAAFAASGQSALDLIETSKTPFDCFLLDVNMPGIDGITLCRRIRAMPGHADTPIIMITRLDHRKYISDAFDAGASDYIVKPFDQAEIGIRVGLAQRRLDSQRAAERRDDPTAASADAADAARLSEAFALQDVPRCVDRDALDTALLRLPSFSRLRIGTLKIVNIDTILAEASEAGFRQMVTAVARILSDMLSEQDYQLSHLGRGTIAFVLKGASDVDCHDLAVRFNDWVADTMPFAGTEPVVVVATDGPSRYIPRRDRLACLQFATDLADDLGEQIAREAESMTRLPPVQLAVA